MTTTEREEAHKRGNGKGNREMPETSSNKLSKNK